MCKGIRHLNAAFRPAIKSRHDLLRAYCLKQRPVMMCCHISPQAIPSHPEKTFLAIDAKPLPVEAFGSRTDEFRHELKKLNNEVKQPGKLCGMLVVTTDVGSIISITWPIAFSDGLPSTPPGLDPDNWKELMLTRLNSGMVF